MSGRAVVWPSDVFLFYWREGTGSWIASPHFDEGQAIRHREALRKQGYQTSSVKPYAYDSARKEIL